MLRLSGALLSFAPTAGCNRFRVYFFGATKRGIILNILSAIAQSISDMPQSFGEMGFCGFL